MSLRERAAMLLAPELRHVLEHLEAAIDALEREPLMPTDRGEAISELSAARLLLRGGEARG